MMLLLWPIITALLNRIRGGIFGDSIRQIIPFWRTTVARISVTGFMLIPIWFKHPWDVCLAAWAFLYVGFIFGWKAWQSMTITPKDIFSMGLRGLILTGPVGLILHSLPLSLCGLSMGVLYYLGKFFPQITDIDGTPTTNSVWGEYMFGSVMGYFIYNL